VQAVIARFLPAMWANRDRVTAFQEGGQCAIDPLLPVARYGSGRSQISMNGQSRRKPTMPGKASSRLNPSL
jgi:hypothetical protein